MNNTPNKKNKQKTRTIIIKNREGFTQVSNKMLSDQKISYKAKGILCHLLSHDTDRFVITTQTLIKHGADGEKTIKTGIKELKANSYLKIIREAGNKGKWSYIINQFGNKFTDIPKSDISESDKSVLEVSYIKNNNIKNNNQCVNSISPEMCEEKKGINLNNNEEPKTATTSEALQQAHTQETKLEVSINEQFGKTEHPLKNKPKLEDIKNDDYLRNLAIQMGVNLDAITEEEYTKPSTEIALQKRTEEEINLHYSQEIAKVEQELVAQRDINVPKLSTESLLGASEEFLRRVGIGFDNNPRRILNLIYKSLPSDCVIKEDGKDVEILGDMIRKYMASRQDERESIAKRIYQAVEAMLKIYVIKKYGEPYREVLYPEILRANLTLYINCNPTFKYCLGGFSNDIDGVYSEVCRLVEKDNKKKISLLKIENEKKLRQLEASKRAELQSIFSDQELADFERRKSSIMDRSNSRGYDEPELDKPIKVNLTEAEKEEMKELFSKSEKTTEDVIRLNFLIAKSKK